MDRIDRIIKQVINEQIYHLLSPMEKMGTKLDFEDMEWVKIGDFDKMQWSNKEMKNVPIHTYIEANIKKLSELEDIKKTSPDKFLRVCMDVVKNNNTLRGSDLIRYVDADSGKETSGCDFKYGEGKNLRIYDEYIKSAFNNLINGYNPDLEEYHKEFISNLDTDGNIVHLHHFSNTLINDTTVNSNRGTHNLYTPKEDANFTYFWASKVRGSDQSGGKYEYICDVPLESVYDYSTNMEQLTQSEALSKYNVVAYYWGNDDAICAKTRSGIPITKVIKLGDNL